MVGVTVLLSACGADAPWGLQGEPARILPGLPGQGWQALPLTRFLTRDTVRAEVLEFCRHETCGFDAVVARLTATGPEADVLAQTAESPARLVRLVREGGPAPARPARIGEDKRAPKPEPALVQARSFADEDWRGASLAITGGAARRSAYGVVLQHRTAEGLAVIVTVADSAELAQRVAVAAASGRPPVSIAGPGAMR